MNIILRHWRHISSIYALTFKSEKSCQINHWLFWFTNSWCPKLKSNSWFHVECSPSSFFGQYNEYHKFLGNSRFPIIYFLILILKYWNQWTQPTKNFCFWFFPLTYNNLHTFEITYISLLHTTKSITLIEEVALQHVKLFNSLLIKWRFPMHCMGTFRSYRNTDEIISNTYLFHEFAMSLL